MYGLKEPKQKCSSSLRLHCCHSPECSPFCPGLCGDHPSHRMDTCKCWPDSALSGLIQTRKGRKRRFPANNGTHWWQVQNIKVMRVKVHWNGHSGSEWVSVAISMGRYSSEPLLGHHTTTTSSPNENHEFPLNLLIESWSPSVQWTKDECVLGPAMMIGPSQSDRHCSHWVTYFQKMLGMIESKCFP